MKLFIRKQQAHRTSKTCHYKCLKNSMSSSVPLPTPQPSLGSTFPSPKSGFNFGAKLGKESEEKWMIKLGETLFSKVLKIRRPVFLVWGLESQGQFPDFLISPISRDLQKNFEQGTFWNTLLRIFQGDSSEEQISFMMKKMQVTVLK